MSKLVVFPEGGVEQMSEGVLIPSGISRPEWWKVKRLERLQQLKRFYIAKLRMIEKEIRELQEDGSAT